MEWQPIETAPLGNNADKYTHIILINKHGDINRGYRIHDGAGKYALHHPLYNIHGQTFMATHWVPLPEPPKDQK